MTIIDAVQVYLLAVMLIPLCICGYALSYVIEAKGSDDLTRQAQRLMAMAVRLSLPYLATITAIFCFFLPAL